MNGQQQQQSKVNVLSVYSASLIDAYLIQTYIVPPIVDIVQSIILSFLNKKKNVGTIGTTQYENQLLLHNVGQSNNNNNNNDNGNNSSSDIINTTTTITLLIQSIISYITLLITNGITPALRQMNIYISSSTTTTRPTNSTTINVYKRNYSFRYKLILYGFIQYIVPILYRNIVYDLLLPYLIQTVTTKQNQLLSTLTTTTTNENKKHKQLHIQQQQQQLLLRKYQRQLQLLLSIQSIVNKFNHIGLPILNIITLLYYSPRNLAMILSGLQYNTISTTTSSSSSLSSLFVPFPLYIQYAYQRYMTFYIWETIRIIQLIPNLSYLIRYIYRNYHNSNSNNNNRNTSSLRPIIPFVLQNYIRNNMVWKYIRMILVRLRLRRLGLYTTSSSLDEIQNNEPITHPSSTTTINNSISSNVSTTSNDDMNIKLQKQPTTKTISSKDNNNSNNNNNTTCCPICQQNFSMVSSMTIQTSCQCQQIYCYACFYTKYNLCIRYPNYDDNKNNKTKITTIRTIPLTMNNDHSNNNNSNNNNDQSHSTTTLKCPKCYDIIDTITMISI